MNAAAGLAYHLDDLDEYGLTVLPSSLIAAIDPERADQSARMHDALRRLAREGKAVIYPPGERRGSWPAAH